MVGNNILYNTRLELLYKQVACCVRPIIRASLIFHMYVCMFVCMYECMYSGANKYLIHCRFFKVSHIQRMERSVIFIVGTPQL